MLIDFMNMKNGEYHEKQLDYNFRACLNAIEREFPEDKYPDLDNPKYAHIIEKLDGIPVSMGGLAESLGLDQRVMTVALWRDLSNGWCPADAMSEDNPLKSLAVETPKGFMIPLSKNVSTINSAGEYVKEDGQKERRIGTEFVFGMGKNTSLALARLAIDDSTVDKRVDSKANQIFKEIIMPEMLKDAKLRKGTDGAEIDFAKEILAVNFAHQENRSIEPYRHFHFDLLNTALGYDGKLYTLMNEEIITNKDKYNVLFQRSMNEYLKEEFGFKFQKVHLDEDINNEFLKDHEKNVASYDLRDEIGRASCRERV